MSLHSEIEYEPADPKVLLKVMTSEEFDYKVKNGAKLVILDGYVLDIASFINDHPGGRFSLNHNIGRDVSKFFHGGYSLENISTPMPHHTHSVNAKRVVNNLIIGLIENQINRRIMTAKSTNRDANKVGSVKVI